MTKIIVCGCNGKMGKAVIEASKSVENCSIVGGIDTTQNKCDNFPVFTSPSEINISVDVIIDFSHPSVLSGLLDYSVKYSIPLVICTTGFSSSQVRTIKKASESVAIFSSRNMSLGISLIIDLARRAYEILGNEFDIEIIEKHHNQKIDSPSGTALMIADELSTVPNHKNSKYIYDRHSYRKSRDKNEIGIHSVRGGNIVGDHEVIFAGNSEVVTISHHAQSKEVFAAGAIKAAAFIKDKSPGIYDMNDLVK